MLLGWVLRSSSSGYLLCNSIRATGAFGGFLIAFLSIQYGGASEYGSFLFAVSIVGFLPDYISSLVVAEYLNFFTRSLSDPLDPEKSRNARHSKYRELFNWFWLSCFFSLAGALLVPAFHSFEGLLLVVVAAVYIYSKQRLTILSEKLRLVFPPYFADFILFILPQSLVILLLLVFHFLNPLAHLNALYLSVCSAIPYLFVIAILGANGRLSPYAREAFCGLSQVGILLQRALSPSGSALTNQLSIATSLSYCSIRLPALFLGFASPQISSVAVYGILQRIQYLISIPGYSFISWNARSLADAASKNSRQLMLRLGVGMLVASIVLPVFFWLIFTNNSQSLSWLFSKNGFGFEVSPLLLAIVLAVSSLLVFQAFVSNSLTALSKFVLLLQSQALRLVLMLGIFAGFFFLGQISVEMIFSAEAIAILASFLVITFSLFFKRQS